MSGVQLEDVEIVGELKVKQRTASQIELAQYFTPAAIADHMVKMFKGNQQDAHILDAGAGEGILGLSLLNQLSSLNANTHCTFVETDKNLSDNLKAKLSESDNTAVLNDDFIELALTWMKDGEEFSHVILNPPYFKLKTHSQSSILLRKHGIQVTNIYAAFIWLSAKLLSKNGELVAIIPRSFCNGPYFSSFREYILSNFSIEGIHSFTSRNKAFAEDSVLQENIILHIAHKRQASVVRVTYSNDQTFSDIKTKRVPFDHIVRPDDTHKTIHIPSKNQTLVLNDYLKSNLNDLGIDASTGPVVNFRLKDAISTDRAVGAIPLLYPAHMYGYETQFPREDFTKKGQFYKPQSERDTNVLPLNGCYVIVRRFSSKEEKRRIFASVVEPSNFKDKSISFENHLNYYHDKKEGFDKDLAYGLCAYLNSTLLDEHFRKISGHTQVNVTDLRNIPYPDLQKLKKLGAMTQSVMGLVDDIVTREIIGEIL